MAGLMGVYTPQINVSIAVSWPVVLWVSLASFLGGCQSREVEASQRSGESLALQSESEIAADIAARLPKDIPPRLTSPEATMLSRSATTADGDLLPATAEGNYQGPFRVGNQTQHPIRLALQTRLDPQTQETINPEGLDLEPVHWDFAPGEGGQSGLLMSVSQGDIEIRNGDVLVAFAQDGSRRYWGPYIVGETKLPYWNQERSEWQLLIQP